MQRSLLVTGMSLLMACLAGGELLAQGGSVYTQSSCAAARGVTAAARPCLDGSAVFYNPAALALLPGAIGVGLSNIRTAHTFTYDFTGEQVERDPGTILAPHGYLTARLGHFGVGIGVFAPYGGGIDWPLEFEGRFVTYDQSLRAIFIQPTAAFAIVPGAVSIGGGVTIARARIDLRQRADLADVGLPPGPGIPPGATFGSLGIPRGTDFADVNLVGSGTGTGWHIAAMLRPADWIAVGARYMHRVTTDLEGDATFAPIQTGLVAAPNNPLGVPAGTPLDVVLAPQFQQPGGALAAQGVQTSVTWPEQAVIGVHLQPIRNLQLLFDYHYLGWSAFDRFPVDFQGAGQDTELVLGFQNAEAWRFGAEYGAPEGLVVRAGYVYNTGASPEGAVSPFLPEGERNNYMIGLGYRLPMGLQADAFFQYIDQVDRRGRVRAAAPGQDPTALNIGVYSLDAFLVGATLSFQPRFLNR
jgi:long-chain fatty acid transport protein